MKSGSVPLRLVLLCFLLLAGCGADDSPKPLHLGAGPGLPKLLADALAREFTATVHNPDLLTRTVGDCCAAASQWALSSRELDLAIMCPDAATVLVEKNADYIIVGPVLLSGEVLVRRTGDAGPVMRVGMAHQRSPQRVLIRGVLGPEVELVEMLPAALPYALERQAVDAVVLDRLVAAQSPMALTELGRPPDAMPTQVLVAHRSVYATRRPELARALRAAVAAANAELDRLPALAACTQDTQGEHTDWTKTLTKFALPPDLR